MANSTKRILALSLKDLLARMPLDKITIQHLVDAAEVSRKTFYYHFQDIYGLLEWTLVDEGRRLLEGRTGADTWQEGLGAVFAYLQENRTMILNIHRPLQGNNALLEQHISQLISPLLERVFDSLPGHEEVSGGDRGFILELYSYGLVKLFLHWIGNGMKPDARFLQERINRLFSGSMESLIRRCIENPPRPDGGD